MAIWAYLLFALAAGAMLPIQFGINAQLAEWIGGSVRAAFVSFLVGAFALFAAVLIAARGWPERAGDAPGGCGRAASSARFTSWARS